MPPVRPLAVIFCTRGEYFIMSNGVFNFYFLALLLSEILGGSQIYTRGPYAPWMPPLAQVVSEILRGSQVYVRGPCAPCTTLAENFCTRDEYFTMSNGIFNFSFLALVLSEILGGPKFTSGGPMPPGRPLINKFFYPKRLLHNI